MSNNILDHMKPDVLPIDYILLFKQLGIKTDMGKLAMHYALSNVQLLDKKQQDYGSQNISRHGEFGVLVRIDDKTARLQNLLKPNPEVKNESLLDTWMDISNYGLIGYMLRMGVWK